MVTLIGQWESDKNVEDFRVVAEGLKASGQSSRADAVNYLIERVKMLEKENESLKRGK
jgi:hypothetical protein